MQRHARWLGIAAQVHFVGRQQDVRPFYGAADVFALPTLYDPFPNAALEAMACGLPVVTSTTSGAAELIEDGRTGFVGDAFDIGQLALNLDAALRAGSDMGAAARRSAETLPIEATAAKLVDLYRKLG
jgi:UDP-glucose:(heptosyl)LPS alpha-1,3-glucosyltransferase